MQDDGGESVGAFSGSREPSPSSTGLGPTGFDQARILEHKWLDGECIERGCQSLLLRQLLSASSDVVRLIEGFPGYGTCTNASGRLKDQDAWVSFYVLVGELDAIARKVA